MLPAPSRAFAAIRLAQVAGPGFSATKLSVLLDSAQEFASCGATASTAMASGTLRLFSRAGNPVLHGVLDPDDTHGFNPVLGNAVPNTADSIGLGNVTIGGATTRSGSDVTRLHVHTGAHGVNGGVVFGVINPSNDRSDQTAVNTVDGFRLTGEWDESGLSRFVTSLLALTAGIDSNLHWNLHIADDAAGAIRGQIMATNDLDTPAPIPLPAGFQLLAAGLLAPGAGGFGGAIRQRGKEVRPKPLPRLASFKPADPVTGIERERG